MMTTELRLNLGCGADRREGYLNIDLSGGAADLDLAGFDVVSIDAELNMTAEAIAR